MTHTAKDMVNIMSALDVGLDGLTESPQNEYETVLFEPPPMLGDIPPQKVTAVIQMDDRKYFMTLEPVDD